MFVCFYLWLHAIHVHGNLVSVGEGGKEDRREAHAWVWDGVKGGLIKLCAMGHASRDRITNICDTMVVTGAVCFPFLINLRHDWLAEPHFTSCDNQLPSYVPFLARVHIVVSPADMEPDLAETSSHTLSTLCAAAGLPLPHITWLRNGHAISNGSYQQTQERAVTKQGLELVVGTLQVCGITPDREAGGLYTCRAKNDYDIAEASFVVSTPGRSGTYRLLRPNPHPIATPNRDT